MKPVKCKRLPCTYWMHPVFSFTLALGYGVRLDDRLACSVPRYADHLGICPTPA